MDNNTLDLQEYITQGRTLFAAGKFEEALNYFKKAEAIDNMNKDVYFGEGETYVMLDKYDDAKAAFSKILLIDKNNAEVNYHLGNIEFLNDNIEKGREYYSKAINGGFDSPELYFNLGTVFEEAGDDDEAIKCYNKVIARDKFRADAKLRKAEIYISNNQVANAVQTLDSMIETNPDIFEGHHYKILLLMNTEDYSGAETALNKAMSMFPDDMAFKYDYVLLLEKKGEYDEAIKCIDNDFGDELPPELIKEKAKLLIAKGNYDEGTKLFEEIREQKSDDFDSEVRYYLINIYAVSNEYQKAIECCDEVLAQKNDDSYYYAAMYFKAMCKKNMGEEAEAETLFADAVKALRAASSKHPEILDFYVYRALCLKELKQFDKALELIDYMLTLKDDFAEAYLIRASIKTELGLDKQAESDMLAAAARNKALSMLIK